MPGGKGSYASGDDARDASLGDYIDPHQVARERLLRQQAAIARSRHEQRAAEFAEAEAARAKDVLEVSKSKQRAFRQYIYGGGQRLLAGNTSGRGLANHDVDGTSSADSRRASHFSENNELTKFLMVNQAHSLPVAASIKSVAPNSASMLSGVHSRVVHGSEIQGAVPGSVSIPEHIKARFAKSGPAASLRATSSINDDELEFALQQELAAQNGLSAQATRRTDSARSTVSIGGARNLEPRQPYSLCDVSYNDAYDAESCMEISIVLPPPQEGAQSGIASGIAQGYSQPRTVRENMVQPQYAPQNRPVSFLPRPRRALPLIDAPPGVNLEARDQAHNAVPMRGPAIDVYTGTTDAGLPTQVCSSNSRQYDERSVFSERTLQSDAGPWGLSRYEAHVAVDRWYQHPSSQESVASSTTSGLSVAPQHHQPPPLPPAQQHLLPLLNRTPASGLTTARAAPRRSASLSSRPRVVCPDSQPWSYEGCVGPPPAHAVPRSVYELDDRVEHPSRWGKGVESEKEQLARAALGRRKELEAQQREAAKTRTLARLRATSDAVRASQSRHKQQHEQQQWAVPIRPPSWQMSQQHVDTEWEPEVPRAVLPPLQPPRGRQSSRDDVQRRMVSHPLPALPPPSTMAHPPREAGQGGRSRAQLESSSYEAEAHLLQSLCALEEEVQRRRVRLRGRSASLGSSVLQHSSAAAAASPLTQPRPLIQTHGQGNQQLRHYEKTPTDTTEWPLRSPPRAQSVASWATRVTEGSRSGSSAAHRPPLMYPRRPRYSLRHATVAPLPPQVAAPRLLPLPVSRSSWPDGRSTLVRRGSGTPATAADACGGDIAQVWVRPVAAALLFEE